MRPARTPPPDAAAPPQPADLDAAIARLAASADRVEAWARAYRTSKLPEAADRFRHAADLRTVLAAARLARAASEAPIETPAQAEEQ